MNSGFEKLETVPSTASSSDEDRLIARIWLVSVVKAEGANQRQAQLRRPEPHPQTQFALSRLAPWVPTSISSPSQPRRTPENFLECHQVRP